MATLKLQPQSALPDLTIGRAWHILYDERDRARAVLIEPVA